MVPPIMRYLAWYNALRKFDGLFCKTMTRNKNKRAKMALDHSPEFLRLP